jgi:hypothetical protein
VAKKKESSIIKDIAYNAEEKTLTVTFTTGNVYAYKDVPAKVFTAFAAAESKGSYLWRHIRGSYDTVKQEDSAS